MHLENLDIVAEYSEYSEGSSKSLWGNPHPCWVSFNNYTKELRIKFEYELGDSNTTYVWFKGVQTNFDYPYIFELRSNKPDVTDEVMELEVSHDGECWYLSGRVEVFHQGNVERRFIDIAEVNAWENDY